MLWTMKARAGGEGGGGCGNDTTEEGDFEHVWGI